MKLGTDGITSPNITTNEHAQKRHPGPAIALTVTYRVGMHTRAIVPLVGFGSKTAPTRLTHREDWAGRGRMLKVPMPDSRAPVLQSMVPLSAVPERLRTAVSRAIAQWGYVWSDVTFAGTAMLPAGARWQLPGSEDVWVFAITVGPLVIGDEIDSAGGRGSGVSVSAFSGGVIPVVPYQAQVYEFLGRRGGGPAPGRRPVRDSPTTV